MSLFPINQIVPTSTFLEPFSGDVVTNFPTTSCHERMISAFPVFRQYSNLLDTDFVESEQELTLSCDLPGVSPENLECQIIDDVLRIKAQRTDIHEIEIEQIHKSERFLGKVERCIKLPKNIKKEGIMTSFSGGVLEIKIPKIFSKRIELR